jgi:hypothetical protein
MTPSLPHVKRRINTPKATRPSCEQSSDERCERQASNAVHRAGTAAGRQSAMQTNGQGGHHDRFKMKTPNGEKL